MKKNFYLIFTLLVSVLLLSCDGSQKVILKSPQISLDPPLLDLKDIPSNEDLFIKQWNLAALNMDIVWKTYNTSQAVVVALMGTGIDYNHKDLRPNVMVNEIPGSDKKGVGIDLVDDDFLAYDHFGHDTYLAGVIGASHENGGIKGILKKVSLYPIRYIDHNGITNFPIFIRGLEEVAKIKPHVVLLNLANIKLENPESEMGKIERSILRTKLKDLKDLRIPMVVGAGNSGADFSKINPLNSILGEFDNIFIITSVNKDKKKPWLANYSPSNVHTSAPGEEILTTAPGNKFKLVSGTSLAAAHVAAAIAYGISEFKGEKSYKDYFNALLMDEASDSNPDLSNLCLGRNELNILKFLTYLSTKKNFGISKN